MLKRGRPRKDGTRDRICDFCRKADPAHWVLPGGAIAKRLRLDYPMEACAACYRQLLAGELPMAEPEYEPNTRGAAPAHP